MIDLGPRRVVAEAADPHRQLHGSSGDA
jgi:hypothetical protein